MWSNDPTVYPGIPWMTNLSNRPKKISCIFFLAETADFSSVRRLVERGMSGYRFVSTCSLISSQNFRKDASNHRTFLTFQDDFSMKDIVVMGGTGSRLLFLLLIVFLQVRISLTINLNTQEVPSGTFAVCSVISTKNVGTRHFLAL